MGVSDKTVEAWEAGTNIVARFFYDKPAYINVDFMSPSYNIGG